MIRLAIIGTNWITEQFVEAALLTQQYSLSAVYSRQLATAQSFKYTNDDVACFDDINELAKSTTFDAIYIASPNSLHFEQSMLMMQHGKHVICEKPFASNATQAKQLLIQAEQSSVILFEAFMTAHLPSILSLKQDLHKIAPLRKAHLSYCQYSSRYQKYLNGENPNTFNPHFSNGSAMDIGFYCFATAAELFGQPNKIDATAILLSSGVDGCGSAFLTYNDFIVTIDHSKISNSFAQSEIQGENGTILLDGLSVCDGYTLIDQSGAKTHVKPNQHANKMYYEAEYFAQMVLNQTLPIEKLKRSVVTSEIITEVRKQTNVVFPADQ
jgi:predicted dehydrogenase